MNFECDRTQQRGKLGRISVRVGCFGPINSGRVRLLWGVLDYIIRRIVRRISRGHARTLILSIDVRVSYSLPVYYTFV